jgi:hypothetical protein
VIGFFVFDMVAVLVAVKGFSAQRSKDKNQE